MLIFKLLYTNTMTPTVKGQAHSASNTDSSSNSFLIRTLPVLALLGLVFIMFFFQLGSYPLFDLDEPRYAEAAREMLEGGDWITPHFNYALRFDKPVFFYWLVAWAYQWFGISEFSARFFSAVTATLTVFSVYVFGQYWVSRRYGWFSALILSSSIVFAGIARMSITDMTLTCLMTATSLSLFMAAHRDLKWWLLAGFFSGLAVLTKGPVGLVVPGAVFLLYTLVIQDFKRCLLNRWLLLSLLVCMAVALPWYVLAYQENHQAFIDALLLHNVARYSDVVSGHKQPVYFYVWVLLAGFLPWTLYLPAAFKNLIAGLRKHKEMLQNQNLHYFVPLYASIWAAFTFIFFTVSNTKLLTYILPLLPALALLMGSLWYGKSLDQRAEQSQQNSYGTTDLEDVPWKWLIIPAWSFAVLVLAGGGVFITQMGKLLPREAAGIQGNHYNLIAVMILLAGSILTAFLLQRKSASKALLSQSFMMGALLIVAMIGIVPNISTAAQGVMMEYLQKTNGQPLILYEIQKPSLTFYGRRRIPRFVEEERSQLQQELKNHSETYVITKNQFLAELNLMIPPGMKFRVIEKGSVYSLILISKML